MIHKMVFVLWYANLFSILVILEPFIQALFYLRISEVQAQSLTEFQNSIISDKSINNQSAVGKSAGSAFPINLEIWKSKVFPISDDQGN